MRFASISTAVLLVFAACGGDGGTPTLDTGTGDQGPVPVDVIDESGIPPLDVTDRGQESGVPAETYDPGIGETLPGDPGPLDAVGDIPIDVTVTCDKPEDCDDGNECTLDLCENSVCIHECLEGLGCDDGNPFSFPDKCLFEPVKGKCFCHGQLECERDKDCNDMDPCTDDWCNDNGQCIHDCLADEPCNDGNPDTIKDTCVWDLDGECGCVGTSGECQEDSDCDDGNECTQDVCTGDLQCQYGCLEGHKCDDDHPFTTDDKCLFFPFMGKCFCMGELECVQDKDCNDMDQCTDDWCDENGQCHHDCDIGAACNDGDPGTIKDECLSSLIEECVCQGTQSECQEDSDCDDGNDCTKDLCTEDMNCLHNCLEGDKCDDGNPFTWNDKCLLDPFSDKCFCTGALECIGDKDCDDGNDCTGDWCDKNGQCHHDCLIDEKCDDGDPDTVKDSCTFSAVGECVCDGENVECTDDKDCDDGNLCTDDWCSDDFECVNKCLQGDKCNDGNPFTFMDKCILDMLTGKCWCEGETECVTDKDCDDGNDCTKDSCDKNGQCHHDCMVDEKCNDGKPDTIKDVCTFSAAGDCMCVGEDVDCTNDDDCDDGNQCTDDWCSDNFECVHKCLEGDKCDDGDQFTFKDKCLLSMLTGKCWCEGETECDIDKDCDDGNDCTNDWCDKNGQCHHDCMVDEKCEDGNPLTIKDTCIFSDTGECLCVGIEVECQDDKDCDDGNECTMDVCHEGNCLYDCMNGMECDDGNPFTSKDVCMLDPATGNCWCEGHTECIGDEDCNDGNDCTFDWCDKNGQCHHDCMVGEKCEDGNPLTIKDSCTFSESGECVCVGIEVECEDDKDCDDGNDCTFDVCYDGNCFHDCMNGMECDDGNPFTMWDMCMLEPDTGICWCEGHTECIEDKDCDDGNDCTFDWCDKNGQCHHDCMVGEKCDDGDPDTAKDTCMFSQTGECACIGIEEECQDDKDCDDGNDCTLDVCANGECVYDCMDGLACDDGNPGTFKDECVLFMLTGECKCIGLGLGCESNKDCEEAGGPEFFCRFDDGVCAPPGMCEEKPPVCPLLWDPVCGCDGKNYANGCLAALAGVSIDYKGQCEPEPEYCWSNDMCKETEYCFFEDCGLETGECVDRPISCPYLWDPVCGCDGVTYANSCMAAMSGVSVDYKGECEQEQCWSNDMCPNDQYCFFADCGLKSGTCTDRPDLCLPIWAPVCGCDGKTYANACFAAMAGESVDYEGECEPEPEFCWSNDMCKETEYCFFEECAMETGTCEDRPIACPMNIDPVCGCDGKTYGNSCLAAAAGVSVDYKGMCLAGG